MAVRNRVIGPTLSGTPESDHEAHEGRMQTWPCPRYAGSRLNSARPWEGAA